ncbi:hypothetical protein N7G274_006852 [Stereocaulon virgatum]|uniref:CoA-binding domain-containing protein n=1 Tax=Stereocaulon virgatum TaxID=373712 RepID=A0ABR4A3A3_9LECA
MPPVLAINAAARHPTTTGAEMESAAKNFFTSTYFAVAGASQSPHKYGYKVLHWYTTHCLPALPITPSRPTITISNKTYPTFSSPLALPHPTETSLSIITQPPITLKVLQEAKEAGVRAVWLQPGSFDEEGLAFAVREWEGAAVGGVGGEGGEGWCVLVDGEAGVGGKGAREERGKVVGTTRI